MRPAAVANASQTTLAAGVAALTDQKGIIAVRMARAGADEQQELTNTLTGVVQDHIVFASVQEHGTPRYQRLCILVPDERESNMTRDAATQVACDLCESCLLTDISRLLTEALRCQTQDNPTYTAR